MKLSGLLCLLAVLGFLGYGYQQLPSSSAADPAPPPVRFERETRTVGLGVGHMRRLGGGGSANAITVTSLATGEKREFKVTLQQILPGSGAIANGGFYEDSGSGWTASGDIFIAGFGDGHLDGARWHGWLIREGAHTIDSVYGTYRLPTYRIVKAP